MTISTISYFDSLPVELTTTILCDHDLPLLTFGNCQKVCQLFNKIVNQAETIWEKWASALDKDNQWKPAYICKSLRDDFTWKWLIIDFKNMEKQTLNWLFTKVNHPLLKETLEKTQYYELTPFLHSDNAETLNLLGESFLYGRGCSQHPQKAIEYFTRAAHEKHAGAQYNLGNCYATGTGCTQDLAKAFHYYDLAASQGHGEALYKLAHNNKKIESQDQALHYLKLTANYGLKTAHGYYTAGMSRVQNMTKFLHDYYTWATGQNPHENDSKGNCQQIDDKIERQTVTWLSAKANHLVLEKTLKETQYHELVPFLNSKNPDLLALLGEAFLVGKACLPSCEQAFRYFTRAANQGGARGQCNLGNHYKQGIGCEKDLAKAFHYYTLAANQEYAPAQCNLGVCYRHGIGCEKDLAKAFEYYKLAADQEHPEAIEAIKNIPSKEHIQ